MCLRPWQATRGFAVNKAHLLRLINLLLYSTCFRLDRAGGHTHLTPNAHRTQKLMKWRGTGGGIGQRGRDGQMRREERIKDTEGKSKAKGEGSKEGELKGRRREKGAVEEGRQ